MFLSETKSETEGEVGAIITIDVVVESLPKQLVLLSFTSYVPTVPNT